MQDESNEEFRTQVGVDPIVMLDLKGGYQSFTFEDIFTKKLNRWKNWSCAAGIESIFIDFDGNVFRGTCSEGGTLGNIFENNVVYPNDWIQCKHEYCSCGADMMNSKYKNASEQNIIPTVTVKTEITDPLFVTDCEVFRGPSSNKRIVWNLGRRCNYDCSYCSPQVHSNSEPMMPAEIFLRTVKKIIADFCDSAKASFFFNGGEPTIFPGFADVVEFLYNEGHTVSFTSNGSRQPEFYRKLNMFSHIALSAHLSEYNEDRFVNVVEELIKVKFASYDTDKLILGWVSIKVMLQPGFVPQARQLAKRIYAIPNFNDCGDIKFQTLFVPGKCQDFYEYTEEELEFATKYNNPKAWQPEEQNC